VTATSTDQRSTDQRSTNAVDAVPHRRFSWRALVGRGSLDIQSKLLVMLLAVSFVAALVIGAVGYVNGRLAA